ncbi:DUF4012 domain-containing protein [Dermatobacter hominis]|uniref:DUF4012 domain-containing protein n=1 Tax=Dermatobacter hominis TaxID=2884263 RepID=UPI001D0FD838|nr:DUF4012 domain-containing protein [Dermatobacter hominis]UDY36852.1 DUF4012 domain-containing protein [Dermatobacter hominis]
MALDAAPTGWDLADAVERAALVALCALAGSRARRWTFLPPAVLAVACGGLVGRVAGAAVVVAALGLLVLHRRHRVAGAVLGAGAGIAVLDLRWPSTPVETAPLLTVALTVAALTPMLVTGYRRSRSRTRRRVRLVAVGLAAFAVVGLATAGLFALQQRDAVNEAVELTRTAVDAVGGTDPADARRSFEDASAAFQDVADSAGSWWTAPARALPVVGSNLEVVRTAASSGARLNEVAADLTESVDQEQLRRPEGGIDLTVLASMEAPVSAASDALDEARAELEDARSPWLVGPVSDRLAEFDRELDRTSDTAEVAQLAVERAPAMLGADGPRRYLLLLGNPAETRDLGGHLGNWAEIVVDDGVVRLVEVGTPYDLFSPGTAPPPTMTPGAYPQSLVEMRPQYFPQNWGGSADLPTVARLAAELYPQARPGAPLDGVFYADPAAFAALLDLTGPVPVAGTDRTISADDAVEFLTREQFAVIPDNGDGSRALDDAIQEAFERFTHTQLPSPRRLGDLFGPVVAEGRLQFASLHPEDDALLDRLSLLGTATRQDDHDLLAVLSRNANPSKVDAYLRREVTYDVSWDPDTGETRSRVTVRLTNDLPEGPLPAVVTQTPPGVPPGTNRTVLSILSPLSSRAATLDGDRTGVGTQRETPGLWRHTVLLDLAPGATRTVTFDLDGTLSVDRYVLDWVGQPLAQPGTARVQVTSSGDALASGGDPVEETFPAAEDRRIVVHGGRR